MALKFSVDTLDSVEEAFRPLYVEESGKFVLDVEGAVPKAKLDEFRNNNIQLTKTLESFKGIDPSKYTSLLELEARVKDSKLVDAGKIDEVVEGRISALKTDYENRIKAADDESSKLKSMIRQKSLSSEVSMQAAKLGVVESAIEDVALRASSLFQLDTSGNLVAVDTAGNPVYGKNGTDKLSVAEWMKDLSKTAPHLFKASAGGGASNARGKAGNTAGMSSIAKISAGLS